MKLRKHIHAIDRKLIYIHLCGAVGLLGVLMVPPIFTSLFFGELKYALIFGSLSLGTFVFGFLNWKKISYQKELKLIDAVVVTALVYLVFSVVGAIPFLPVKPFLDGLFESMSGFTTTGLTMMNEAKLPSSLIFFRAYSQWLGGMGVIVISLAILIRPGKAAFKLYSSEFGEENIMGSVEATAKMVIKIYLALTVLGFVAFLLAGMGVFDGLIHILTTIPTGGFSAYSESIGYYDSSIISLTVSIFMILGAISFPLYYQALKDGALKLVEDEQARCLFVLILIGSIIFLFSFGLSFQNIVPGIFQTVSSITTTGFNTVPLGSLSEIEKAVTTFFMIIGGNTGSTAGGIKIFRFLILLGFIRVTFFRSLLAPEAKIPLKYGKLEVGEREAESVAAFFVIYLIILFVSTLAIMALENLGFTNTLFEVASAEGTVGLSVGITSSSLTFGSKLILILNMWLGRLEILPVLVALYPGSWSRS